MEFKLPFPTLQELAVLTIAHSLMDLEVSHDSLVKNEKSLREFLKKVDKLKVHKNQKCQIREVLKGTSDHLLKWYISRKLILDNHYSEWPKIHFDVHGCVHEVRMVRDHLQKCLLDERVNNDLKALKHSLILASHHALFSDVQEILPKILKLLAADSIIPQLKGPEFEIETDNKLCLVYKFVDQQQLPMSLNVNHSDDLLPGYAPLRVSNNCVRLTLNHIFYNSELFQLHWNLIEPSKRMTFVKKLTREERRLSQNLVDILHFLDPVSQRYILGGIDDEFDNYMFLLGLLVWPYQAFFLPAFEQVRSQREFTYELNCYFQIIVGKQEITAFEEILSPFWEATSSVFKSRYSELSRDSRFRHLLKNLSRKNAVMYQKVAADLKLRKYRKRKRN